MQAPAELRGPDGELLAARIEPDPAGGAERLLIPASPLQAGNHVLTHGVACSPGGVSQPFTVGPAVSLPTTIGTVRLEPQPAQTLQATWMDGCGWTARATTMRIVLQPSAELQAYLPLARFTLNIDGKPWATSAYGSDRVAPPDLPGCDLGPAAVHLLRSVPRRQLGSRARGRGDGPIGQHCAGPPPGRAERARRRRSG